MSMNKADLYGMMSDQAVTLQGTSVTGPDQGSVAPSVGTPAMGTVGTPANAAFTWCGFILALVILRLLIDLGGRD